MKNTQAHKLSTVLEYGNFYQVDMDDYLLKLAGEGNEKYFSIIEKQVKEARAKGWKLWKFETNDKIEDIETCTQFSPNPYTLIDLVFYEIVSELNR